MQIKKILETRIDVTNINDMFCADYNKNIIQILKTKYNKKCFKSIYILDILRITHRSKLNCKSKVLDGTTYIDVSFEVLGIIYEKGDIIHNSKIIQINNNGTMHAKSEYASIHIKNIDGLVVYKELEEVPVLVNMTRYNIFESEVSVSAIPFVPIIKKSIIYELTNNATDDQLVISEYFDMNANTLLENNITEISKKNKAVHKFFVDLIYPYKAIKKIDYGTSTLISLENLNKHKAGDLLYRPDSSLVDKNYYILNESDINKINKLYPDTTILKIGCNEYKIFLLNEYYKKLSMFYEFVLIYDTPEKIKEKGQFWSLYNVFKK